MAPNFISRLINKPRIRRENNLEITQIKLLEKEVSSFNFNKSQIYEKAVPETAINSFFTKLENGTFKKFFENRSKKKSGWIKKGLIEENYKIVVFPITKSSLGTVRIFNEQQLNKYIHNAKSFYNQVKEYKNDFQYFKIQPINILGIKKLKNGNFAVLEKVHPSMSVSNILFNCRNQNRFGTDKNYNRLTQSINSTQLDKQLKLARTEYKQMFVEIDKFEGNILVLDYEPKTKKFVFGAIDFSGNNTKSMPN